MEDWKFSLGNYSLHVTSVSWGGKITDKIINFSQEELKKNYGCIIWSDLGIVPTEMCIARENINAAICIEMALPPILTWFPFSFIDQLEVSHQARADGSSFNPLLAIHGHTIYHGPRHMDSHIRLDRIRAEHYSNCKTCSIPPRRNSCPFRRWEMALANGYAPALEPHAALVQRRHVAILKAYNYPSFDLMGTQSLALFDKLVDQGVFLDQSSAANFSYLDNSSLGYGNNRNYPQDIRSILGSK